MPRKTTAPAAAPLLAAAALLTLACPGTQPPSTGAPATAAHATTATGTAWTRAEGCPPVAVPDGDFELLGDPRACKGGRITLETNSYPTHLNVYGPERDNSLYLDYAGAMFLPLVSVHPNTLQVIPQLATFEEKVPSRTYVFRIDPDARWSDGVPVTAKDVVATYDLIMAPEVTEVVYKAELDKFERPVIVDERTVEWEAKETSWRNIIVLADILIQPAHAADPKTYLDAWRWKPPVTCGPYSLGASEEGKFFEFVRNQGWWGETKRQFVGLYNFDSIYRKVVESDDITFEMMKKGDIDYYLVTKAQRWIEECDFDKIRMGWIQKQKMYMREPQVPSQMAFNLTDPLFEDVRVRRGLFWLFNREYVHDQLTFRQYRNKNSYWANSIYENPDNEKVTFDPEKGLELLAEAGWSQKDQEGFLVKDGKRFEFDFIYIHSSAERIYTPIQETYRKYGIKMNLKLIQPSAWVKVSQEKDFRMIYANWGSTPFPNPRVMWHSENADKKDTSNVGHFKNAEVDALIEQYEAEPDLARRAEIVRQMDAIIYRETPYLLDWYSDNFRNLWWDKFGMPEGVSYSSVDIRNTNWITWWYDEARAKRLEQAMASGTAVPQAPPEDTRWKLQ